MNPQSSEASNTPQRQANTAGTDLESRVKAAARYLARPEEEVSPSIQGAGGTVVRVPFLGSFHVSPEAASRAGLLAGAVLVIGAILLCLRHQLRGRDEG